MSALAAFRAEPPACPLGIEDLPMPALRLVKGAIAEANALAKPVAAALGGDPQALARLAEPSTAGTVVKIPTASGTLVFKAFAQAVAEGTLVLLHDVTVERDLINAMADSRSRFTDFVRCSADFAWETDGDGRFAYVSPKGALGLAARDIVGRPALDFMHRGPGEAQTPFEARTACEREAVELVTGEGWGMFEVSAVPRYDEAGIWRGARGVCRDVTEARRQQEALSAAQARLAEMARSDSLTGLLNRGAFVEALGERLGGSRAGEQGGALFYIDLNRFKLVNDTYGHAAGDDILRRTADLLRGAVRASDLVARVGGDEFVLWLHRMPPEEADRKAAALTAAIAGAADDYPAVLGLFGASVGYAFSSLGDDPEGLMATADGAMYDTKKAGRGE